MAKGGLCRLCVEGLTCKSSANLDDPRHRCVENPRCTSLCRNSRKGPTLNPRDCAVSVTTHLRSGVALKLRAASIEERIVTASVSVVRMAKPGPGGSALDKCARHEWLP